MKNYILTAILVCSSIFLKAQTSTGIHHIKYLEINTGNSDYSVDFLNDAKVVFTTSTSDKVSRNSKNIPHLDLFVGDVGEEGEITNKTRNKGIVSKGITKTGATFTNDNKTVYFSAKKYSKRRITGSELFKADIDEEGNWINVQKLSINKKNYTIEHPTLNKEETQLYFSSNLPSTIGGKDIFVSEVNSDGTLGEPKNLGDKINTYKDEITPFISDNNFLYYSSNGREDSLGNFDIYTSESFENAVSEPLHLDAPINSINDDFAYIVNSDKGYFSSNRLQGQNNDDIYSFYIEPDKPVECFQEVIGTVRDADTEKVMPDATVSVINDEGTEVDKLTTDENGNYRYKLGCRNTFTFRASKEGYSIEEHIVNTANYNESPSLEVNQNLNKEFIEVEDKVTININSIYFGFDKFNINEEARVELDKIVKVMKTNPQIEVESASHTDSRGSRAYNQMLSERRAKATVDYIVSKGIDKGRIKSKGYGEDQLLNECKSGVRCTNDQHQYNRRTEFVILNKQTLSKPKETSNNGEIVFIPDDDDGVKPLESVDSSTNNSTTNNLINEPSIENKKVDTQTIDEKTDLNVTEESSKDEDESLSIKSTKDNTINQNDLINESSIESKKIDTQTIDKETYIDATKVDESYEDESTESKFSEDNIINFNITNEPILEKELPEVTILNTSISVSDNHENEATSIKDLTENNNSLNRVPDKGKINSLKINKSSNTITNKKEEALTTNASSFLNTKSNDISTKSKKIELIAESVPNQKVTQNLDNQEPIENNTQANTNNFKTVESHSPSLENKKMDEELISRDLSVKKNNISAVYDNLFDDEDDAYDDSKNDSRLTNNELNYINVIDKEKLITYQKQQFKQEFVSNTKELKEEEVLALNSIDVSPISIKNNGKYVETKSSTKVDVMRIEFQINNNDYITPGYKEVYILIQNPKGIILNRKGTFEVNNSKRLTYTEKTNAYYNNNFLNISMVTDRFIQEIIKGIYTITIYIEGYPVGLEMVELS